MAEHPTPHELSLAMATCLDAAASSPDQKWSTLATTFSELGWLMDCADCAAYIYPDQKDVPCVNCGHVQGDPRTGSTPDDRDMRVCLPCMLNEHERCDGGDPHDLEEVYCNCKRLGHINVRVHQNHPVEP